MRAIDKLLQHFRFDEGAPPVSEPILFVAGSSLGTLSLITPLVRIDRWFDLILAYPHYLGLVACGIVVAVRFDGWWGHFVAWAFGLLVSLPLAFAIALAWYTGSGLE